MYPLPNKVAIEQREVNTKDYLLVPEYNSFGKPKWPKIITYKEYEEIEKKTQEMVCVRHHGPIRNEELGNDFFYYIIQPYENMWFTSPPLDPLDKNIEYYLVQRNS